MLNVVYNFPSNQQFNELFCSVLYMALFIKYIELDRDNVKTETLGKTVATLRVLMESKWMIDFFKNKQGTDKYTQSVVENSKKAFDKLFVYDNGYGEGLFDELADDFQKL